MRVPEEILALPTRGDGATLPLHPIATERRTDAPTRGKWRESERRGYVKIQMKRYQKILILEDGRTPPISLTEGRCVIEAQVAYK